MIARAVYTFEYYYYYNRTSYCYDILHNAWIDGEWKYINTGNYDMTGSYSTVFDGNSSTSYSVTGSGFTGKYYTTSFNAYFYPPLIALKDVSISTGGSGSITNVVLYNEFGEVIYNGTPSGISTAGLNIINTYPVNEVGYINTSVENFNYLCKISATEKHSSEDTSIRYLLSFDNNETYCVYRNGIWVGVPRDNIMTDGMTLEELESINTAIYNTMLTDNKKVDITAGLISNNELYTPTLESFNIITQKIKV